MPINDISRNKFTIIYNEKILFNLNLRHRYNRISELTTVRLVLNFSNRKFYLRFQNKLYKIKFNSNNMN